MARVELRELGKGGRTHHLKTTDVAIDGGDEEACVDLLRRMARQHGKSAAECEIAVKVGTKTKTYRV
ncbi:hypothetical protein ABZS29_38395 [Kribbella sp. NPDC005582]|uniref:hypothetical protein n=1 Tax=Kribbella sp. NPDC005582 TaxID=3156893 RepID=UPI0033B574C7